MTNPIVKMVSMDELKGEAKKIYQGFITKGKKVPKWVEVMANCEDILVGFFTMFKATMDDAPLPAILKWKVADEVSRLNQCEFCLDVTHAQLKQFGVSDEALADLVGTANGREKIALAYARAMTEKAYEMPAEVVATARQHFSDEELVELAAVVGLFNYINRFNDALGVLPE
ncbi:MAG: hypothetical protein A2114_00975 [Candidatus Vogelbacteria bacterium GWA1_51_14]|uniref:Carboxymuconolactone decarboxylase-like domain-containing protein n=1 Tax=Candidatus Vogelbacteria bacterium GWA1_51_14 TaxID=1802435 RepID=A0A1G2QB88_9BACT|nr:MAG: hypothetical protein A2114_00975 [Candidatus Vogelbacteria bacterium GWA1_51_14]